MNIAIYGTGHFGEIMYQNTLPFTKKGSIKIVYFIETKRTKDRFHEIEVKNMNDINPSEFDVLVIAVAAYAEIIHELSKHPEWVHLSSKIKNMSQVNYFLSESPQNVMPYKSVRLSNKLCYLSATKDVFIGESMCLADKNYAEDQIKIFFDLMKRNCMFNDGHGYFLDIGANIGTTCIYAKKMLAPNLQYIGFEAGAENYKLFKCNCILNKVEDIIAEKQALGETECKGKFFYNELNPGGSGVLFMDDDEGDMDVISLDDYITKNNIEKSEIRCIWLDTEGCEAEILLGAQSLLGEFPVPLMQEFNPFTYEKRGKSDAYYELMEKAYHYFIDIENIEQVYPIDELKKYSKSMEQGNKKQADLFIY